MANRKSTLKDSKVSGGLRPVDLNFEEVNQELLAFLDASPNAFFAVDNIRKMLITSGYTELKEADAWKLNVGEKYFVVRNGSAIAAFQIPKQDFTGFQIMASHADSPAFKVKPNADIEVENAYLKLNVEKYGGAILSPWLDRPLSAAGRIAVAVEDGVEMRLVNLDRDLMIIPNLAIHMNREVNSGYKFRIQKDLLPLFSEKEWGKEWLDLVAEEAGVKKEDILDTDLFLYDRMRGTTLGANREFIACGRLDDLQCAFASVKGFLAAEPMDSVPVCCIFDNEEVGSGTKQGAAGTFLRDVLHRINDGMGRSEENFLRAVASGFMVSADNAHAIHPNHGETSDPTNRPILNHGIVIKYNANQKYTTDAVSGALFRKICERAGVPYQTFVNQSDQAGGSTLGNIAQSQISLNTVDIGLPQLSMHSPYETAGAKDTAYLAEAARVLFSSSLHIDGDGVFRIVH